jgi:DNA-binding NtrC family response regulator
LITILLAEDDPAVRSAVRSMLREIGYHVLEARNASRAIELLRTASGPIDLLLTDVVLPVINGIDLARAAQQIRPTLKVVYMSGHTDDAQVKAIANTRANFLQKPFGVDELNRTVSAALADPGSGHSA